MKEQSQWQAIDQIFCEAIRCRKCFDQQLVAPAFIDVAQPRWIGLRYFAARTKVVIILLNPSAANKPEKQQANIPFRQLLYDYRDGKKSLKEFLSSQRQYIQQWGNPPERFVEFYIGGIGLDLDKAAIANIAWCADARNKHPSEMLLQCFRIHTSRLIGAIAPDIAILSGSDTHKYASDINEIVPSCRILYTMHYSHREGHSAERAELQRVRKEIENI